MPIQELQPHLPGATFEFTMWEDILCTQGNPFVINYTVTCSFLDPVVPYTVFPLHCRHSLQSNDLMASFFFFLTFCSF